jgi:hypothetical protein
MKKAENASGQLSSQSGNVELHGQIASNETTLDASMKGGKRDFVLRLYFMITCPEKLEYDVELSHQN